jgi:hypothetical protein
MHQEDCAVEHSELAFCTTQELVSELVRRSTFLGVVVHSDEEWRGGTWGEERSFKVHFNSNLTTTEARRLLETIAEFIDRHHC